MRTASEEFDAETTGTTVGDTLEVNVWRDPELLIPFAEVSTYSLSWDASRPVQGQGTFTFPDPSGELAPWSMEDALAPFGSRIRPTFVSGLTGTRVPFGSWRIRKSDPVEPFRNVDGKWTRPAGFGEGFYGFGPYGVGEVVEGGGALIVPGGGTVVVQADEETATVGFDRLDAEPVVEATCLAEVVRLLQFICPVSIHPDIVDRPVPPGLVYESGEDSRLRAVVEHVQRCEAAYRMGPDDVFEIVPEAGVETGIKFDIGDGGRLVSMMRQMSDDGVYNAVISTSETADGAELVGRSVAMTGPLSADGPFGRRQMGHRSPADTQSGVTEDATTLLANRTRTGEVRYEATVLAHPGLQILDRVTVEFTTVAGEFEASARIESMTLTGTDGVPAKSMPVTLSVSTDVLAEIGESVRRAGRYRRG